MNLIKPRFVWVSLAAISVIVIAAAPSYHLRRSRLRCCLPDRDYQYRAFSQPLRSLSATALLLPEPARTGPLSEEDKIVGPCDPRERGVIKSFQFTQDPRLVIDHCSISDMAVLLYETGKWSVNLRANQNPLDSDVPLEPRDVTTAEERLRFTDHLLRNQFYVRLYCYAEYGTGTGARLLGKPVVVPIDLKPFWVQREVPYLHFTSGCDLRIKRYFDLIDRVEIEFSYRYDSSQARRN